MRYPVTTSAVLAGVLLLGASRSVLASCEGKLLCTEFTDPPTRQEVVVAPAKVRAKPDGEHRAHQHRVRARAAAESKKTRSAEQKHPPSGSKEAENNRTRGDDRAPSKPAPRTDDQKPNPQLAGAEPASAVAALVAPEAEDVDSPLSAKLLIEDGFNAVAAGPSDDPEQQALFVLRYLTGRAHASAVDARAPLPAPAQIAAAGDTFTATVGTSLAEAAAPASLHHVVLLDLAAALGGIGSLAAAFTVLSGRRFRLRADGQRDRQDGVAMPVQVMLRKPQLPARAQAVPERPLRKQPILRVEHLFARRIPLKSARVGLSRVAARPKSRTRSS